MTAAIGYRAFSDFVAPLRGTDPLRQAISASYRTPEPVCIPPLVEAATLPPATQAAVAATARSLIEALRSSHQPGGVQAQPPDAEGPPRARRFKHPDTGMRVERGVAYAQWRLRGFIEGFEPEVVVDDEGHLAFGTCGCGFYQEHLLSRGPCPHMLALLWHSEPQRREVARVHTGPLAPRLSRAVLEHAPTQGGDDAA